MGESFHFDDARAMHAVTVGPPGQRVFFLQFCANASNHPAQWVNLKLEKQQVAALADHLDALLVDLPPTVEMHNLEVRQPDEVAWIVGALGAAYDQTEDRIIVVAEELVDTDEDGEPLLDDDEGQGMLTVRLTRSQVRVFIDGARDLIARGRPDCPWCGRPMDVTGHLCPRMN
jgi:uncharacterized repeat protein (TIGR03847 family)